MLPAGRLDPDDFPDSPYARELRTGIAALRFDDTLEPEYLTTHLRRVRMRVRAWFSLSVVLATVFFAAHIARMGIANATFWVQALGVVPCALTLSWLAWSSHYPRWYMPAARFLVPLSGALIAIFVAQAVGDAQDEELAWLTVSVVAAFFFTGLLFRASLFAALAIIVSFSISGYLFGIQTPFELIKSVLVLVVTALTSAVIYRDIERTYRSNYLESGLIAELTARDGLTGLATRRAFDEHLLRVWQQAQRDGRILSILMVDIDHFKNYNDSFGHQAGDAALQNVGQVLQGFARRPLDIAARFGGEEFAVVLYDLSIAYVIDIAERMRQAAQFVSLPRHEAANSGLTISIGVGVVMPTVGRTPQGAVQLADEALYESKNSGRNRVVLKGVEEHRNLKTGSFKGMAMGDTQPRLIPPSDTSP